jgi:hypothetical protein
MLYTCYLPDHLDAQALASEASVPPPVLDKLRTVVQVKLAGWAPFMARQYFAPLTARAKAEELSVGTLVSNVLEVRGAGAALVVLGVALFRERQIHSARAPTRSETPRIKLARP